MPERSEPGGSGVFPPGTKVPANSGKSGSYEGRAKRARGVGVGAFPRLPEFVVRKLPPSFEQVRGPGHTRARAKLAQGVWGFSPPPQGGTSQRTRGVGWGPSPQEKRSKRRRRLFERSELENLGFPPRKEAQTKANGYKTTTKLMCRLLLGAFVFGFPRI
jgi:hypothetical protein